MSDRARSKPLILVAAGEESGDARGAEVISAFRKRFPDAEFYGIGGDRMAALGVNLIFHMRDLAFLGFMEVVRHLPFILRVFKRLTAEMTAKQPDLVLLIDYPGFNLRFAKKAKKLGFKVAYYVSPQIWAWGRGRLTQMARTIDRMHVIFPFEEAFYRQAGLDVRFVGHPLAGSCRPDSDRAAFYAREGLDADGPLVGLLPGSRHQEISRLLPQMAAAAGMINQENPAVQFIIGKAPALNESSYLQTAPGIRVSRYTHDIMAFSDLVLVASGTATLETALFTTPMIICYRMAPFSYLLGRLLVKIKHIGLANIVAEKQVVPELIQRRASAPVMAAEALRLLADKERYAGIKADLAGVADKLGDPGAAERVAQSLEEMISS